MAPNGGKKGGRRMDTYSDPPNGGCSRDEHSFFLFFFSLSFFGFSSEISDEVSIVLSGSEVLMKS